MEKQLSEKNTIIDFLTTQLVANSQVYQKVNAVKILSKEMALINIQIMTSSMKNKALKIYETK